MCEEVRFLMKKLEALRASGVQDEKTVEMERTLVMEIGKRIKSDPRVHKALEHDPTIASLINPSDIEKHPVLT